MKICKNSYVRAYNSYGGVVNDLAYNYAVCEEIKNKSKKVNNRVENKKVNLVAKVDSNLESSLYGDDKNKSLEDKIKLHNFLAERLNRNN